MLKGLGLVGLLIEAVRLVWCLQQKIVDVLYVMAGSLLEMKGNE